jgi:uncharacterized DUF497 family protein
MVCPEKSSLRCIQGRRLLAGERPVLVRVRRPGSRQRACEASRAAGRLAVPKSCNPSRRRSKTAARKNLRDSLKRFNAWCKLNRHLRLPELFEQVQHPLRRLTRSVGNFVRKYNEPLQIGVIRRKPIDVTTTNIYNRDMSYEWDEQKRQINVKKHGVDFVDVPEIFDGDIVTLPDERFDYGETRFIVIGILKSQVVVVVYTERGDNIRIISARKATKNEQIYYFQQISN